MGKKKKKEPLPERPAILVTVGTTNFDQLVLKVCEEEFYRVAIELGFRRMYIQAGDIESRGSIRHLLEKIPADQFTVKFLRYVYRLWPYLDKSDLVITHGGAGTCLEALRLDKKVLIVPNENLMHNHQHELADVLCEKNYGLKTNLSSLVQNFKLVCEREFVKFPPKNPQIFGEIFDNILKKYKYYDYDDDDDESS